VSAILPVVELTANRGATAPCADDSFQVGPSQLSCRCWRCSGQSP